MLFETTRLEPYYLGETKCWYGSALESHTLAENMASETDTPAWHVCIVLTMLIHKVLVMKTSRV